MKKRIPLTALLVGALIGATSLVSGPAAAADAARAYAGTISLHRTCSQPDNNMNESVQFAGVVLAAGPTVKGQASWQNMSAPTVTVTVNNVNTENPSISVPSKTFKDEKVGILLMIRAGERKGYDLIVGPVQKIPATIKAGGETIKDFWDVQGETAADMPLPADPSRLKGTKTITDTGGAKIVLAWDLQLR